MADETIDPSELAGLVKVRWHNDPNKFRYVTKDAVALVSPKWLPAEDQSLPENVKKTVVSPVARPVASDQSERINELRKMYAQLGGTDEAVNTWNRGRLEIEVVKLENAKKIAEPEAKVEVPETKTEPSETTEKPQGKKRGPKKKVATPAEA